MTGKSDGAPLLSPTFLRLTLANFCFFLTFASFFLLPLHVRALGGTERTVGFVMGTNGIAGLVSVFLVGPLLDRHDRRRYLRGGLVLMGAASLGYLFVDRIGPVLFALRIVQGIAFAAAFSAASTLAAELAPPTRRAAALGIFGLSTLGTHALAPAIGEQLLAAGGFDLLFVGAAGYSVVGLLLTWGFPASSSALRALAEPLSLRDALGPVVAVIALVGIAFGTVITFMPTFVHVQHLGPVSTFFLAYTAAAIGTRLGAGGLGDAFGHHRVVVPALALMALAIGALALVHTPLMLAATGVLFGAAQGIVYPTLNAFALERVPSGRLGRIQTLFNGAFNLGVTTGAFALGTVADSHGHRPAFLCASATALVALVLFVAFTRDGGA